MVSQSSVCLDGSFKGGQLQFCGMVCVQLLPMWSNDCDVVAGSMVHQTTVSSVPNTRTGTARLHSTWAPTDTVIRPPFQIAISGQSVVTVQ